MSIYLPFGATATNAIRAFSDAITTKARAASTSPAAAALQKAREQLKTAAAAFVQSFLELNGTQKNVVRSSLISTAPTAPKVLGRSARVIPMLGRSAELQTTRKINTLTDTTRRSKQLGLDLSGPASSVLSSSLLGLDTTSPSAASRLESSSDIGLDLTTPASASQLYSSSALGLDLASPNAPSTLRSSSGVGLDVASPESASVLRSASLGLDLTSPSAPSVLSSSSTLGLDVTSPESASTLRSSTTLGLDVTSPETASTIVSTAAINTSTTNYDPSVSFSGGATSVATLSGTFAGVGTAASATSLTVKMATNVTLDSTARNFHFQILDQTGTRLVDYTAALKAGDKVYLGDDIGLFISFSAGTAVSNATGSAAVSHSAPTVNLDATFNNADPDLRPRFDNGAQVTAGSFSINGTSIAVNANDSINSVISRINSSAAGVTASFASGKMTLTTNAASEDNIYLSGDTSGFLAAMKLAPRNEEINAATTSVGTRVLSFANSTATATISGDWTGVGDFASVTGLTVKFTQNLGGLLGGPVKFSVLDQSNKSLFSFNSAIQAGQKIAIGNESGLWITFTDGTFVNGDTASTTVSKTVKTDVDANATFNNANLNLRPRFENGAQVTAGSFTVNGTTVAVNAGDSINSVISRINSTVSGVTASFANDRITIVNNSGSNPVVLANDTSGFLAATKLAGAVTSRGNVRDDLQVLSKTSQFSAVTNGSFSINGTAISVDKDTDSVSTIINRINSANAGVSAAYDSAQDKVVLTSTANSEDPITISGDTSGFAAAAKLVSANTVRGNIRDDQQVLAETTQFGAVTTGSFTINGTAISVDKDADSLSSIIARINASAAGVTATYDAGADRLVLTGTTDSEHLIAVAGDTAGFLTAAKLATGNTVRGHLPEDTVPLYDLSRFAGVVNGSFVVDGHSISVATTDTIQSIVSRINSSGARVTAAFDSATNKINLTTTFNTEDDVAIGSDTSGFLTAAGIDATNTARGNLRDDQQFLAKTTQFAGVSSGSFTINGVSISLDRDTDTLSTVIDRINAANAGVTAAYDSGGDTVLLTGTTDSEDLIEVDDDTTGFLSAVRLATANTVRGHLPEDGVALENIVPFMSVVNGSFDVDGHTIDVDVSTDTIQSIVDRINQSGARVTASYDSTTDRLALVDAFDSEDDVAIGNDTSGFLSAAHLSSANTVRGNLRDDLQVLSKTSQFGGVVDGSFTINGVEIDVDTSTDTLASLVSRINGANAGVTATLNADRLQLVGTTNSEDLIDVGNDDTGFLAAALLDANNTVRGNLADEVQVLSKTSQFAGVTSGTLSINGAAIDIDVDTDSVATVVGKINGANAGVTAVYDSTADRIVLTTDAATEDAIVVDDDTGFAAAAGLDTNNTVRGNLSDDLQVLSKTSQFAAVVSGSFNVNGAVIDVDVAADSVTSIVSRINAANVGVTAAYDIANDRLVFTPSVAGAALSIDGDTSGFLAAADVAEGTVGTHVNASAAFDGSGLNSPLFEPGVSVGAGSFEVNGTTINVLANDSISSVLARISASNAGVDASYDDATQTVKLVTKNPTSTAITVGNDTSGFLTAVKIDGSEQLTAGRDTVSAFTASLQDVPEFSDVQAGTVTVNGTAISVDPSTTTLRGFVAALDGVDGVSATIDETTGDIRIVGDQLGGTVSLADTSGLLAKLGISTGDVQGRRAVHRTLRTDDANEQTSNAAAVASNVAESTRNLNEALTALASTLPQGSRDRTQFDATVRSTLASLAASGVEGLDFRSDRAGMRFLVDTGDLTRSLNEHAVPLSDAFRQYSDVGGQLGALMQTLTTLAGGKPLTATHAAPRWLKNDDLTAFIQTQFKGQSNLSALRLALGASQYSQTTSQATGAQAYADIERSYALYKGS